MPVVLSDGLTRADNDFKIGDFFNNTEGLEYVGSLFGLSPTAVNKKFNNFTGDITGILSSFNFDGNLDSLIDTILLTLQNEFNFNMNIYERNLLAEAYRLACSGFKFNLPDLNIRLHNITFAFMISMTICGKKEGFAFLFNLHGSHEIIQINDEIRGLQDGLHLAIYNTPDVAQLLETINTEEDTLRGIKSDTNVNTTLTEYEQQRIKIDMLNEQLYGSDKDTDTLQLESNLMIAEKEALRLSEYLQHLYLNTVDVALTAQIALLNNLKKQLSSAINTASTNEIESLRLELKRKQLLHNNLLKNRNRFMADVAVTSMKLMNNKIDPDEASRFLKDILDTPVKYELSRRDITDNVGTLLDNAITVNRTSIVVDKVTMKQDNQPTYVKEKRKQYPVKPITKVIGYLENQIESNKERIILTPHELKPYDVPVIEQFIKEVLKPNKITIETFKNYTVLRSVNRYNVDKDTLYQMI